jgi:hypothetical protein
MRFKDAAPEKCQCCGRMEPLHGNGACDRCVDKWEEAAQESRRIRHEYSVAKGREDAEGREEPVLRQTGSYEGDENGPIAYKDKP